MWRCHETSSESQCKSFCLYLIIQNRLSSQIEVDESGKIVDAKFKTFGCGSAIASSSLATEWVKGKSLDEAGKIKNSDIAKELCLPPVKLHCSSTMLIATLL